MSLLDFKLALRGSLRKDIEADQARIARGVTSGIGKGTDHLKQRLRDQITGAGLGPRLANSVRSSVYPRRGASMSAAGSVFSKGTGAILKGWNEGSLIRPKGEGRTYLAIPTENCPPRRRAGGFGSKGKWANPHEVETIFNQDLKFFKVPGGVVLAYIDGVKAKNKRGWRPVTKGRLKAGREPEKVIMFVLIRQARLRKRLNIEGAYRDAATGLASMVAVEIDRELKA